jgi:hypothetical protein
MVRYQLCFFPGQQWIIANNPASCQYDDVFLPGCAGYCHPTETVGYISVLAGCEDRGRTEGCGVHSLVMEWAKDADVLPREPPHRHADEALMSLLWQASAGLLGIVVLSASSVVFKTWTDSRRRIVRRNPTAEPMLRDTPQLLRHY